MIGKGTKVMCISVDDEQSMWFGNSMASQFLTVGKVYTLADWPEFGAWNTSYCLEEFPNKKFNSVQFKIVETETSDGC